MAVAIGVSSSTRTSVKWLSSANVLCAIGLALFVLLAGPTTHLFCRVFRDAGGYLQQLLPLSVSWYDSQADKHCN